MKIAVFGERAASWLVATCPSSAVSTKLQIGSARTEPNAGTPAPRMPIVKLPGRLLIKYELCTGTCDYALPATHSSPVANAASVSNIPGISNSIINRSSARQPLHISCNCTLWAQITHTFALKYITSKIVSCPDDHAAQQLATHVHHGLRIWVQGITCKRIALSINMSLIALPTGCFFAVVVL